MKRLPCFPIIAFFMLALFAACDKNEITYSDYQLVSPNDAFLKVNFNIAYYNNPSFFIKVNGDRVSPSIATRYPFPGGGYNTLGDSRADYLRFTPGELQLSVILPKKGTTTDSLEVFKTNVSLQAGKNYTLHLTDTAANIKSLLTEDNVSVPDSGFARYRFVNLMPNVPSIDLYYGASATDHTVDTLIAGGISYLTSTGDIRLSSGLSKTWKIRPAGLAKTATPIAHYTSASTFSNSRAYTIFATGYNGKTSTVQRPYVSFFLVK